MTVHTTLLCGAVLAVFLLSPSADATAIRSLRITGNLAFSSGEIQGWMATRQGTVYSPPVLEVDRGVIETRYRDEGYLAPSVRVEVRFSPDSGSADLLLDIREGKRTLLAALRISGLAMFSQEEIIREFDLPPGSPPHAGDLEAGIARVIARYERSGHPFVRCSIGSMEIIEAPETDSLVVRLVVEEGDRVTLQEIEVRGADETDPDVVTRETRLVVGEPYDEEKVRAIRERLQRLNIFSAVDEPQLYIRDGKGGLLIGVHEGRTSTFDGVVGYVPPVDPSSSGYVTGLVSVAMRNLFGTGRRLSARWQRADRSTQELDLRYTEPWLFALPLNAGGGLFIWQQDSAYVQTRWDVRAELMLTERLSLSGLVTSDQVIPSADAVVQRLVQSSTVSAGAELLYDTRDDLISPTSGGRFRADYLYGRKRNDTLSAGIQRAGADLQFYYLVFPRQVLAFGIHGRSVEGGLVDESDMFRLGGYRTLRGYRENQFLGSLVGWANLEYRFLAGRRTYLFGFTDAGYYRRPADDPGEGNYTKELKLGFGIGARLDTALGNIGVSVAMGQGDTIGMAKIHVGLINDF